MRKNALPSKVTAGLLRDVIPACLCVLSTLFRSLDREFQEVKANAFY